MAYERISCQQAKQIIDTNSSTVIDIRDRGSFEREHIDSAIHVDKNNVKEFIQSTNKTQPLIVYCYHGNLSQAAADFFNQQGFEKTYSVDGGFTDWDKVQ